MFKRPTKNTIHIPVVITDQKISMSKLSLFIQKHDENDHHQYNKHEMAIKKKEPLPAILAAKRKMESLWGKCIVGDFTFFSLL